MATMTETNWGADPEALASLGLKLQVVRDWVTAVAKGYQTGLYLHGSGGIGKSHAVLDQLEKLGAAYRLHNSRMTAKGLYLALAGAADAVHVLEDVERLTADRDAQGVLRSALWAAGGRDRVVTWTTATGGQERFTFRGGIILLANRPLASLPELRALATRISVYRLDVTDPELAAMFHELAAQGYRQGGKTVLEPEACSEVAQHLLNECRAAQCPLDLRLLLSSYHDYLAWAADVTGCHWRDLVAARARQTASNFAAEPDTRSCEERKAYRRSVLREIMKGTGNAGEQERLYRHRTGTSRADYFRRKREIESGEFDAEAGA
jgi:hypothetical protein